VALSFIGGGNPRVSGENHRPLKPKQAILTFDLSRVMPLDYLKNGEFVERKISWIT
jgi:hypothetical protein